MEDQGNQTPEIGADEAIENQAQAGMAVDEDQSQSAEDTAVIAAERQRTAAINEALAGPEFDALRKKALAEGMTVSEAKAAAFELSQQSRETENSQLQGKLAESQARVDEDAETSATDGETGWRLQPGDEVKIRGGGAGYISQISADGAQVRVAEAIPDDPDGRVGKRWVPAADVELSE